MSLTKKLIIAGLLFVLATDIIPLFIGIGHYYPGYTWHVSDAISAVIIILVPVGLAICAFSID
jgi:hypothetical protein